MTAVEDARDSSRHKNNSIWGELDTIWDSVNSHDGDAEFGIAFDLEVFRQKQCEHKFFITVVVDAAMNYIVMQQQLLRNDRNYGSTASNEVLTPKSSNNAILFPHRDDTLIKDLISIAKAHECYTPLSSNNTSMTSSAWSFASLNEESQTSDVLTPSDCNGHDQTIRNSSNADICLSMVSNFSAAYNSRTNQERAKFASQVTA